MWEYCITFEDKDLAYNFKRVLTDVIKSHQGIITDISGENAIKILIALPIIERFKVHNVIREKIAETILTKYKREYILSRLEFEDDKTLDMQIFLKALVVFDSDIDKDIIMERLKFDSELVVKSFIDFRLKFLKKKWDELVNLANDNSMYLLSGDTSIELIKFLISNLEYRFYVVNVFSRSNCYLLCDKKGEAINDFLIDNNIAYDDDKLLTSLIALNPEKIIVHCDSFLKDKLLSKLYDLFSNRVELSKK